MIKLTLMSLYGIEKLIVFYAITVYSVISQSHIGQCTGHDKKDYLYTRDNTRFLSTKR